MISVRVRIPEYVQDLEVEDRVETQGVYWRRVDSDVLSRRLEKRQLWEAQARGGEQKQNARRPSVLQ